MPGGTVFIGEDFDDEPFMWPGLFSAHWESSDGPEHEEGPEGVQAQEAIEWGRTRADVVLIRLGDSDTHYSAGAKQPESVAGDELDLPVWPEGRIVARRREAGRDYLDRTTADPPIWWEVQLICPVPSADPERFAEKFADSLSDEPLVRGLTLSVRRGTRWSRWLARRASSQRRSINLNHLRDGPGVTFSFLLRARTHPEAEQCASDVHDRAYESAAPASGLGDSGFVTGWMEHVRPAPEGR